MHNLNYVIIIVTVGFMNFSLAQQNKSDSLLYVPNNFVETLLKENDSLKYVFQNTKDKLTKSQIESIFIKTENKEYSIKKTLLALKLTALYGDSWSFDESLNPEKIENFDSFEELEKFNNSLPITEFVSFEKDGTLKKLERTFNNGSKEVIEKNEDGKYLRTIIDKNGIENVEEIKDISKIQLKANNVKFKKH